MIAAGDENHIVRYWHPDGKSGAILEGHHGEITHVRWSPNGKWVASTSMGFVPTEPGQQAIATARLWHSDGIPGPVLEGHSKSIRALAWSPDSEELVTASEDRRTLVWATDGTMIDEVSDIQTGVRGNVFSLEWNAADDRILAGGRFSVHFFDTAGPTGPQKLLRPRGGKLMHMDWHPTDDKIAIGAGDATVYIWSDGFRKKVVIDDYETFVGRVKWSPDGQQLATLSREAAVRIWSPEGEFISEFDGQSGVPRGLSWTPDGQRLAVAIRYAKGHIFNADGDDVPLDFHKEGLSGTSFSPDGKKLATCGWDGVARILDIETEQILAIAIHVAEPQLGVRGLASVEHHAIAFNQAGQVTSGDPEILEQQFVYLVEQPSGAFEILKPSEFLAKAPGAILAEAE